MQDVNYAICSIVQYLLSNKHIFIFLNKPKKNKTGQLFERERVRLWSGRSEVQTLGQSNRTQCCQRLTTAATFLQKMLCCPGAMRWAAQTRYTLWRNTASIMKDLIWTSQKAAQASAYFCLIVISESEETTSSDVIAYNFNAL